MQDPIYDSLVFEIDQQKIIALSKEVEELSSEAEVSLKEYFLYIQSLSSRKPFLSHSK